MECCSEGWPCEGQPTGSPKHCQSVCRVLDHIPYQDPFSPACSVWSDGHFWEESWLYPSYFILEWWGPLLFWTFTAAKRYRNLSRWSVDMEEPKSWHCVKSSASLKSNYTSAILNVFSCSFCNWIMTLHCLMGHLSILICRCFLCLMNLRGIITEHSCMEFGYIMHVNFSDFKIFSNLKMGPSMISRLLFPIIIVHKKYQILMCSFINCVHVVLRWSIWAEQSDRAGCCSNITAERAIMGTLFLNRSDKRLL